MEVSKLTEGLSRHLLPSGRGSIRPVSALLYSLLLLFATTLLLPSCKPANQQDPEKEKRSLLLNLWVIFYYESGECAYSVRKGSEWGQFHCLHLPRVQCSADRVFDFSGGLIVTQDTADRYAAELSTIKDRHPECTTAVYATAAIPGIRATSSDHNAQVRGSTSFQVIDGCDGLGNSSVSLLAGRDSYDYLTSSDGLVAIEANLLGQTACYNAMADTDWKRSLVQSYNGGSALLATTCNYGSSASAPFCTSAEKNLAAPFDFTPPL